MMNELIQMREENEKKRIRVKYLWKRVRMYVTARRFIRGASNSSLKNQTTAQFGVSKKQDMIEFTKKLKEMGLSE